MHSLGSAAILWLERLRALRMGKRAGQGGDRSAQGPGSTGPGSNTSPCTGDLGRGGSSGRTGVWGGDQNLVDSLCLERDVRVTRANSVFLSLSLCQPLIWGPCRYYQLI